MSSENPKISYLNSTRGSFQRFRSATKNGPVRVSNYYPTLKQMEDEIRDEGASADKEALKLNIREQFWPELGFIFGGKALLESRDEKQSELLDAVSFLHRNIRQRTKLIIHMEELDRAQAIYKNW